MNDPYRFLSQDPILMDRWEAGEANCSQNKVIQTNPSQSPAPFETKPPPPGGFAAFPTPDTRSPTSDGRGQVVVLPSQSACMEL
jgi:hypothetical protein